MFSNIFYELVSEKFEKYFETFDQKHLKVDFYQKQVHLVDLKINTHYLNKFLIQKNIPIKMKAGIISKCEWSVCLLVFC